MFNLFAKNNYAKVSKFFLEIFESKNIWILANINRNTFQSEVNTREFDLYSPVLSQFKMAIGNSIFLQIKKTDKTLFESNITNEQSEQLNQFIDELIQKELTKFGIKLNETKLINPLNRESEFKAHEWIKVSFKVLKESITHMEKDSSLLNSFQFFLGINPKTELREIRVIIHNLDIQYILLNDGNLRIKIWNDKDQGFGATKTPALSGDFSELKREMFDELIQIFKALKTSIDLIS